MARRHSTVIKIKFDHENVFCVYRSPLTEDEEEVDLKKHTSALWYTVWDVAINADTVTTHHLDDKRAHFVEQKRRAKTCWNERDGERFLNLNCSRQVAANVIEFEFESQWFDYSNSIDNVTGTCKRDKDGQMSVEKKERKIWIQAFIQIYV